MTAMCKYESCNINAAKGGYCNAHYIRKLRGRDMDGPIRRIGSDPMRFTEKVARSDGCWEWLAYRDVGGYGRFMLDGIPHLAHRIAYIREFGEIPDGLEIDHTCHNRACVKPSHLRPATRSLNGQNQSGARRDSASGIRGVYRKPSGRWAAEAQVDCKKTYLGLFDTAEEAETAVIAWRKDNMPYSLMDQKKAS